MFNVAREPSSQTREVLAFLLINVPTSKMPTKYKNVSYDEMLITDYIHFCYKSIHLKMIFRHIVIFEVEKSDCAVMDMIYFSLSFGIFNCNFRNIKNSMNKMKFLAKVLE